jgi:hypothetical protein
LSFNLDGQANYMPYFPRGWFHLLDAGAGEPVLLSCPREGLAPESYEVGSNHKVAARNYAAKNISLYDLEEKSELQMTEE